jgi:hypothetical protein
VCRLRFNLRLLAPPVINEKVQYSTLPPCFVTGFGAPKITKTIASKPFIPIGPPDVKPVNDPSKPEFDDQVRKEDTEETHLTYDIEFPDQVALLVSRDIHYIQIRRLGKRRVFLRPSWNIRVTLQ